ncbi:MAG: hypothetical protein ACW98F_07630 [Candidatus Hodarchaeales archaeon]|jgi:hypothetical protein
MIIKNLWIISKIGLCHYHYAAEFSDYQIDDLLFAGLVSGLANFAESLSSEHKSVEYLKLGDDELYFESIGEIIVAAIVTGGVEKLQPFSVKLMLQFIGTKFVEKYLKTMENLLFDWSLESGAFTQEITNFLTDEELLEDIKREQFQNLFTEAIAGNVPVEYIYWRGIQLFSDSKPEILRDSIKKIASMEDVISTVIQDDLLEGKLQDVLYRLLRDLKANIFKQEEKKLLILSESEASYEKLRKILQSRNIHPFHCTDFEVLSTLIEKWDDSTTYDILVIHTNLTPKEIRMLHNLEINGETKIIAVVNRIPRSPRGRLIHKRPISYIVQEDIETFNRNSPFVEYLLTSFVQAM